MYRFSLGAIYILFFCRQVAQNFPVRQSYFRQLQWQIAAEQSDFVFSISKFARRQTEIEVKKKKQQTKNPKSSSKKVAGSIKKSKKSLLASSLHTKTT